MAKQECKVAQTVLGAERKKRTIQEIRDSKSSGEKMVYMSVPDYTSARWAEMAGVDVAVVGDSLCHVPPPVIVRIRPSEPAAHP